MAERTDDDVWENPRRDDVVEVLGVLYRVESVGPTKLGVTEFDDETGEWVKHRLESRSVWRDRRKEYPAAIVWDKQGP